MSYLEGRLSAVDFHFANIVLIIIIILVYFVQ